MKSSVLTAAILLAATGAAAAQPSEEAPPTAQGASASPSATTELAEAAPQEERKICRTERATGSLTRRTRICMTRAQWREIYDNTQRGVGQLQGGASGGNQCLVDSSGACQGSQTPGVNTF